MNHFIHNSLAILLTLLLAACASQPAPKQQPGAKINPEQQNVQGLLMAAERASPPESNSLKLSAVNALLADSENDQARRVLSSMQLSELTEAQLTAYIRFQADSSLRLNQPKTTLKWLTSAHVDQANLSKEEKIAFGRLRASAYYETRSYLASATELVFIDGLLDHSAKQANHEQIWNALAEIPETTLTNLANTAVTSDMRGWLSLSAMAKKYRENPTRQLQELNNWKLIWSYHPAAKILPSSLALLADLVSSQPRDIALLLPLHGELAAFGGAIRDGFLAAHYQNMSTSEFIPEIHIFDTSGGDIVNLYNTAVAAGAEMIVGPLDKANVTKLKALNSVSVPILSLNRAIAAGPETGSSSPQIYQFGLSPEDEVIQVAGQAWMEGLTRALVIAPNDEWGTRNSTTFMDTWHDLGGAIAEVTYFNNSRDYSEVVQELLNINDSEKRASDLRRIIRERFEFTPRRRMDIDFIFLLANPTQARGINPTLAFYYAEDLPVYSTSHINSGSDSLIDYIDLNGVRFCDIPWKLSGTGQLYEQVTQSWEAAKGILAPFYALGIDAYHLHPRLKQLEQIPDAKIFGMSGILTMDDEKNIRRRLSWAQIRNGQLTVIPQVVDPAPALTDGAPY